MSRILVVDDKELMRDSVAATLARAGHTIITATNGKSALAMVAEKRPDLVLTDLKMPEMSGLELLESIRRHDEQLPVVLMTAFATVQTAVEAIKHGAFDYITKPFESDQLVVTINRALEHHRLVRENAVLESKVKPLATRHGDDPALIGASPAMLALKEQIERLAQSNGTVLIMGESGVGKEVVAQSIHRLSARAAAPMLAVNCAALSASLLESELFGHERGAFTGADKLRKGRFELADGGTLLLDEISEVPSAIQAKLLRVLQERAFERVGSSMTQKTDVRLIATTNRELRHSVASGNFRQDLYFRLHVLPVYVPPLRDRLEDVPALANHFLSAVAEREGRSPRRFAEEALAIMMRYSWPGNVRELHNVCERASILSTHETIDARLIASWLAAGGSRPALVAPTPASMPAERNGHYGLGAEQRGPGALSYDGFGNGAIPRGAGALADYSFNGGGGAAVVATPQHGVTVLDPEAAPSPGAPAPGVAEGACPGDGVIIRTSSRRLEDIEREVILRTLDRHRGHRQRTASELGIGVRTLGLKLRKWKDEKIVAEDL